LGYKLALDIISSNYPFEIHFLRSTVIYGEKPSMLSFVLCVFFIELSINIAVTFG
jgi:hypothetical protein